MTPVGIPVESESELLASSTVCGACKQWWTQAVKERGLFEAVWCCSACAALETAAGCAPSWQCGSIRYIPTEETK